MSGCLVDVAEFDTLHSFYKCKTIKARKEHRCSECRSLIKIGELYEYEVIKGDDFYYVNTCLACKEIRDRFCCSWYYEMIWEHIMDEIDNQEDFDIGCLDGLSKAAIDKFLVFYEKRFEESEDVK